MVDSLILMRAFFPVLLCVTIVSSLLAQTYTISTIAGGQPFEVPATSASMPAFFIAAIRQGTSSSAAPVLR